MDSDASIDEKTAGIASAQTTLCPNTGKDYTISTKPSVQTLSSINTVVPASADEKQIHKTNSQTLSIAASTLDGALEESGYKRDARFWLVFVALCCCTLLSALDLVSLHLNSS